MYSEKKMILILNVYFVQATFIAVGFKLNLPGGWKAHVGNRFVW